MLDKLFDNVFLFMFVDGWLWLELYVFDGGV